MGVERAGAPERRDRGRRVAGLGLEPERTSHAVQSSGSSRVAARAAARPARTFPRSSSTSVNWIWAAPPPGSSRVAVRASSRAWVVFPRAASVWLLRSAMVVASGRAIAYRQASARTAATITTGICSRERPSRLGAPEPLRSAVSGWSRAGSTAARVRCAPNAANRGSSPTGPRPPGAGTPPAAPAPATPSRMPPRPGRRPRPRWLLPRGSGSHRPNASRAGRRRR